MLALLRRQPPPAPPEEPPIELLSPARQALVDANAALAEAREHYTELDQFRQQLYRAETAERDCEASLDEVADMERTQLDAWSISATGPVPAPLADLRTERIAALADAHAAVAEARRVADAIAPRLAEAHAQFCKAQVERTAAAHAVTFEVAAALAKRARRATLANVAAIAAIAALRDQASLRNDGSVQAIFNQLLIGGGAQEREQLTKQLDGARRSHYTKAASFLDRVLNDPTAELAIDAEPDEIAIARARQRDLDAPRLAAQEAADFAERRARELRKYKTVGNNTVKVE